MAEERGFIKCGCGSRAVVLEFGGQKAGTLYTRCQNCGTNQGGGMARQETIKNNMCSTLEEYNSMNINENNSSIPAENQDQIVDQEQPVKMVVSQPQPVEPAIEPKPATPKTNNYGFMAMMLGLGSALGFMAGRYVGVKR